MNIINHINRINQKMNTKNNGILLLVLLVIIGLTIRIPLTGYESYVKFVYDLIILSLAYTSLENLIFTVLLRAEIPIIQHNIINLVVCSIGGYSYISILNISDAIFIYFLYRY
jgi:hypothetical protein